MFRLPDPSVYGPTNRVLLSARRNPKPYCRSCFSSMVSLVGLDVQVKVGQEESLDGPAAPFEAEGINPNAVLLFEWSPSKWMWMPCLARAGSGSTCIGLVNNYSPFTGEGRG